jgi:hypothetical protein
MIGVLFPCGFKASISGAFKAETERAILESKYIGLGKRVFSRITALLRHAMLFLEERRIDEIVQKKGEGG